MNTDIAEAQFVIRNKETGLFYLRTILHGKGGGKIVDYWTPNRTHAMEGSCETMTQEATALKTRGHRVSLT